MVPKHKKGPFIKLIDQMVADKSLDLKDLGNFSFWSLCNNPTVFIYLNYLSIFLLLSERTGEGGNGRATI